jgi:hypothetical protein
MLVILQTWCQIQRTTSCLRYLNCGPEIYNAITVAYNQASIFNRTFLCCHWRCLDNSTRVILQTWCQIQRTSSTLRHLNYGPGHIQCIYRSIYSGFNIQLNVSALPMEIYRQFSVLYTANMVPNTAHILQFALYKLWSGHIQCTYSSTYSDFNIQLNESALLLEICRQFNVRYTAYIVPNTAHILQFTLSELWSRTYTMEIQSRIFKLQYSTKRICAAIGDMSSIQYALYCIYCAKYSAYPPVYAI